MIQTGEEIKHVVCGLCPDHCVLQVKVENGRVVKQYYEMKKSSRSSRSWHTTVTGCTRARCAADILDHPERLNYPLKRKGARGENKWRRVSWQEALDDIAARLADVRDRYGAEAVAFTSFEENNCASEYRTRFQALFGSPNLTSQGQICYGVAVQVALSMIGGVVHFPAINPMTKCLVLLGANIGPAYRYPWHLLLDDLKNAGKKLIVIDPRVTDAAARADIHLQLRPGTDAALLLGMINVIVNEGLYDKEFVDKWCLGFDKLVQRVQEYPPEKVSEITWVPVEKIREAARMYANTKPSYIAHSIGHEQIPNVTRAFQARYILPAITGNLDVPGGEPILSPHPTYRFAGEVECSDVMSPEQEAKMIGSQDYPFYSSWAAFHKLDQNTRRVRGRRLSAYWFAGYAHTPSVWRTIITGKPYPINTVINVGTNPLLSLPNTRLVYEALKKVDFHAAIDIFMTPTCLLADYVLPAACYLEKPFMFGGDYYPLIVMGEAAIPPMYERKREYDIWRELALRLGQNEYWPWESLEEAYNWRLEPLGKTFEEAVKRGAESAPMEYKKYEKVGFGTPSGKIELAPSMLEELGYDPLPSYTEWSQGWTSPLAKEYPLILTTGGRNRHYFNSQYRQIKGLRSKSPDPLAQLNTDKAQELGIKDGDWIWIETPKGKVKFKCQCTKGILPDVVNAEFGWWFPEDPAEEPSLHGLWKSNINVLLDDGPEWCDPISGAWVMRGVQCRISRAEG